MPTGAWSALANDSECSAQFLRDSCQIDMSTRKGVLVLDSNVLHMALTSLGRFDAYLIAIFACALANSRELFDWRLPDLFGPESPTAWHMASVRATHGIRVYFDSTQTYRVTQSKYEWYVTLLTSGSLRAVQDTFHDLANEIWHAQFTRGDTHSIKLLEKLLVALLGHSNDMVRSQAAVFLNNLYDQHDWQQDFPFLPIVKCVGDQFKVVITMSDVADPEKGEIPQGVFAILSGPAFEPTARFETYTYHAFKWEAASKAAAKSRLFGHKRTREESHLWTGTIDLGIFPRCGYFDWRAVRVEPEAGSWAVVQCTIGELRDRFDSSFSFLHLNSNDQSGQKDSFTYCSKNLWPELGKLSDAKDRLQESPEAPSMYRFLPLQGRFIAQASGVRDEQMHEIVVDHQGARISNIGQSPEHLWMHLLVCMRRYFCLYAFLCLCVKLCMSMLQTASKNVVPLQRSLHLSADSVRMESVLFMSLVV